MFWESHPLVCWWSSLVCQSQLRLTARYQYFCHDFSTCRGRINKRIRGVANYWIAMQWRGSFWHLSWFSFCVPVNAQHIVTAAYPVHFCLQSLGLFCPTKPAFASECLGFEMLLYGWQNFGVFTDICCVIICHLLINSLATRSLRIRRSIWCARLWYFF